MDVSEIIRDELRRRIESGELTEGDQIPSELELARNLRVSRANAREALVELELEGYILRYQGRGSFVAPADHRIKRLGIKGFRVAAMSCVRLSSHYKRTVIEAFTTELHANGVQALTYFLDPSSDSELRFLQGIRTSGVEGLALWLRDRSDVTRNVLATFRETRFPFVLCDRFFPGVEADAVVSDNERIGYDLTKGLISQGHNRIVFLGSIAGITATEDRMTGFLRALGEEELPCDEHCVRSLQRSEQETSSEAIKGIMARKNHPTAMFCSDDSVLSVAIDVLRDLGYDVPGEMAFATVDDDRSVRSLGFPVLSVRQNGAEIGRQTAQLLLLRMADPQRAVEHRVVPPVLAEAIPGAQAEGYGAATAAGCA